MRLKIVVEESHDPGGGRATLGRLIKRVLAQENAACDSALSGKSQRRNSNPREEEEAK